MVEKILHPGYKRTHHYLVVFAIIIGLTAVYIMGLSDIFGQREKSIDSLSSASSTPFTVVTKVYGTPVYGDIGAGPDTVVTFMTQESGSNSLYFYAIAFYKKDDTFVNTSAIFLGDRISPQGVSIADGIATFNYCGRKADQSFAVPASVCVKKNFQIISNDLIEI